MRNIGVQKSGPEPATILMRFEERTQNQTLATRTFKGKINIIFWGVTSRDLVDVYDVSDRRTASIFRAYPEVAPGLENREYGSRDPSR
jgi:hypothetical protein